MVYIDRELRDADVSGHSMFSVSLVLPQAACSCTSMVKKEAYPF